MAGMMAATLVATACSPGLIVNAASTSTTTTQSDSNGQLPSGDMPSGEAPTGDATGGTPPDGMGGANTMTYDYSGTLSAMLTADATEVTADQDTYTSTTASQNVALAQNAGTLTIDNATLQK